MSDGGSGDQPPQTDRDRDRRVSDRRQSGGGEPASQDRPNQAGNPTQNHQPGAEQASRPPAAHESELTPGKKVALFLLGVVLLFAVTGANISVAADRTVLDSDYVTETLDEEGAFSELTTEFRTDVSGEISSATDGLALPPGLDISELDSQAVAQRSVTEPYVREEVTANIDQFYAFLRGDQNGLELAVDFRPVKSSVSEAIVEATEIDTPTLVGSASDDIDAEPIAALGESEERFQETQAEYDISDSDAEALKSESESNARAANNPEPVTDAVIELQHTVIDALAGELTYDEYTTQLGSDEQALKGAIAATALADVDDRIQLSNEDEDPADAFSGLATATQWLTTFAWLLPLVSVGLVGVIWGVTRSFDRTATTTGWTLLIASGLGLVVGFGLRGTFAGLFEDAATGGGGSEPGAFFEGMVAAVGGTFGALGTQSLLLAVACIVLLGAAVADRRGHLDGLRRQLGFDPANHAPAAAAGQPPGADSDERLYDHPVSPSRGEGEQVPTSGQTDPGDDSDETDRSA